MNVRVTSTEETQMKIRERMMQERDDEQLSLFLDVKNREEQLQNHLFHDVNDDDVDDFDVSFGSEPEILNISSRRRASGSDDFLNSENDKNDYDWLLTPPGTPSFRSLEMESRKTVMSAIDSPKSQRTALKSRLANAQPEPGSRGSVVSKQSASSPGLNSSGAGMRRPTSSGGPGSRPATPTGRSTLTSASKPARSSTPTSRATMSSSRSSGTTTKSTASAAKPTASTTKPTGPTRSSTPTRPTARPSTPTRSTGRSSTPTRSTARSSTPTARPSVLPSKSTSRASTPTRRPSASAAPTTVSALSVKPSPSVTRSALTTARNSIPSSSISAAVKSRPWKPSDMPGFSYDAPPNLRTSLPERPLSTTRGRPGGPSSRSSSIEPIPNGRPRRQSCSPARGRASNGAMHLSGSSVPVPAMSRLHAKANNNVSPVQVGTKMVERVVNMRKLAPPKQDDKLSPRGNLSAKSSSPDSSGFGRTLSKKSLDMAIRHMDIRRSIPGKLRPLMTNIPASSMYSVRSDSTRNRTVSASDSPLATSSNGSSEVGANNNGTCSDVIEVVDDVGNVRCSRSPVRGR